MDHEIVVIIPTFNERNGIIRAISGIKQEVPGANIIVVDDNSPDKTADLVSSHFKKDKRVQVFIRKRKGGRGSAVIDGFRQGLKSRQSNYFLEMDADLCHNPKYIKKLVAECKNADLVIASRYLPESKATGWSAKRQIMSRAVNYFAKLLLQLPISDYTDGFRCYSRRAAKFLCSQKFYSKGYIVLSEAAYKCYEHGFIIKEIPINIHFKSVSKSNLNLHEVKEAVFTLLKLRFS